ncbi:MAG: tRNA (adenosine(37)-N6)-dimethylallyltransferase MiaA [Candidatus Margulisiibacteriota bacterium]
MHPDIYIIIGPTAAGKTRCAIDLAKKLVGTKGKGAGEIISADSMQVYKGMNIGTAKPTKKDMRGVPHHLIDIKAPDEEWNVSLFVEEANRLIEDIRRRGKIPIIVGGTGLYIWTFLEGFAFPIAPSSPKIRARLEKISSAKLHAQLKGVDPAAAAKIHPNDKKRIIRALEVYKLTGKRISELQKNRQVLSRGTAANLAERKNTKIVFLNPPREKLYKKIEARVDKMIKKGLVREVKGLLKKSYAKNLNAFQALGYKEIIDYLDGKYALADAIELIKKRTRQFAKRQLVWFRRLKNAA